MRRAARRLAALAALALAAAAPLRGATPGLPFAAHVESTAAAASVARIAFLTQLDIPVQVAPAARYDSLRSDGLLLLYHPAQAGLASDLARATADAPPLPALPPESQPRGAEPPIRVWLAPDEAAFRRLSGGSPPEWGAGIALPERGVIVLPAYATDRARPAELPRILRHELAHVGLARALPGLRIPRWLHEGYARWAAGELDPEATWRIRVAFALGRAPDLDSLTLDWPGGAESARLAYMLSASAVQYLVEEAGERGLRRLFERWRESGDLDMAMRGTYGVTLGQFEEDWKQWVGERYGWAAALAHATVFWAIASILLVWLFVRRRRRDREKLERMRATEPPDQPAYWEESYVPPPVEPPQRDL